MKNQTKTSLIISQWGFFLYLTTLSMLGFIATDMYLPAFKSIEGSLDASTTEVAMSLTTFLAGLAMGQLLYGKLVERWGKRQSLLFGLAIFVAATGFIVLADNIVMFNIGRFFQAIGVCSAGVIWQALVIEKYDAQESQKVMSNIMPLVALSPALAPLLGSLMLTQWGWQSIFLCLIAIGVMLLIATLVYVAKAQPVMATDVDKPPHMPASLLSMLNRPFYVGNVMIFAACSAAFFSYLTLWPAVMDKYGFDARAIGLSFIPQTIMFIVGGYGGKILIKKFGSEFALKCQLGLFFTTSAIIGVITLMGNMSSIYPLLIVFALMAAANGAIYPIVVNDALQTFKQDAAKAAGLQNFIQISVAFGASSIVAMFAYANEVAIGAGIVGSALLVAAAYVARGQKDWSGVTEHLEAPDPAKLALKMSRK